jgi:hypothetical protein
MRSCLCIGHDNPYLVIYRARIIPDFLKDEDGETKTFTWKDYEKGGIPDEELKSADLIPVAKTEPILDEISPTFKEIKEKMQIITGGGKKSGKSILRFSVKCWDEDSGDHKCYGSFVTQIDCLNENN